MRPRPNHLFLPLMVLTAATFANDAHACGRTGWTFSDANGPDCVTATQVGTLAIEIVNDCSSSLDLTLGGSCTNCYGPESIAAGDIGLVGFEDTPTETAGLQVSWEVGGLSGGTMLVYRLSNCSSGDGCSAAPPRPSRVPWGYAALVGVGAFANRSRRRSRRV